MFEYQMFEHQNDIEPDEALQADNERWWLVENK